MQQQLVEMEYLIIDEMSMVGKKTSGQTSAKFSLIKQINYLEVLAIWKLWPASSRDGPPPVVLPQYPGHLYRTVAAADV